MTPELDIEALKRLKTRLLRIEGPPDILEATSIPVFHWTYDLIEAHIAALEDLERLRAEIEQHNIQRVLDESHEEGWDLAARIVEQDAEIASLEDRERLRAALQRIVEITTADRLQVGSIARAALEGRDG